MDTEGIIRKLFAGVIIVPLSLFPIVYPPDRDAEKM